MNEIISHFVLISFVTFFAKLKGFSSIHTFSQYSSNLAFANSFAEDERFNTSIKYTLNEEKLLRYLFKNYNPNIMPKEFSETLKLYIGLAMIQLIYFVIP